MKRWFLCGTLSGQAVTQRVGGGGRTGGLPRRADLVVDVGDMALDRAHAQDEGSSVSAFELPSASSRITSRSRAVSPAGSAVSDGTPAPSSRASAAARPASCVAPSSPKASSAARASREAAGSRPRVPQRAGERKAGACGLERRSALTVEIAGVLEGAAGELHVACSPGKYPSCVGDGRAEGRGGHRIGHPVELL